MRCPTRWRSRRYAQATLDWAALDKPEHRARFELVQRLLAARKSFIMPRLPQLRPGPGRVEFTDGVLTASWFVRTGEILSLMANLSDKAQAATGFIQIRRAGVGR